jgi:LuxR family maltose regulon positive regulatory protein
VATWLGVEYAGIRGDLPVGGGWLKRAAKLLENEPPCAEKGWVALWEAHMSLLVENDSEAARTHLNQAAAIAASMNIPDLETACRALEGVQLVRGGRVEEGMKRLDETTTAAIGGEFEDFNAVGNLCCYLLTACEQVRDYGRAAQWCERVKEFNRRHQFENCLTWCRRHYAMVLMWRGQWSEAEEELETMIAAFRDSAPAAVSEGVIRMAELRRLQGRWEEAESLFAQLEYYPIATLGRSAMALDSGDAETALGLANRYLRRLPRDNRIDRIPGLDLKVRALAQLGRLDEARQSLAELGEASEATGTDPVRALFLSDQGSVLAAGGDNGAAAHSFEDAMDLFERSGSPYETSRARVLLASSLRALGRTDAAAKELRTAGTVFERLGARADVDATVRLLEKLKEPAATITTPTEAVSSNGLLTPREREVLALVARGLSNQEIATRLFLSEHTVKRHVANLLGKLDLPSRTAAAAYAVRNNIS